MAKQQDHNSGGEDGILSGSMVNTAETFTSANEAGRLIHPSPAQQK
jgi:hypothetical protein